MPSALWPLPLLAAATTCALPAGISDILSPLVDCRGSVAAGSPPGGAGSSAAAEPLIVTSGWSGFGAPEEFISIS